MLQVKSKRSGSLQISQKGDSKWKNQKTLRSACNEKDRWLFSINAARARLQTGDPWQVEQKKNRRNASNMPKAQRQSGLPHRDTTMTGAEIQVALLKWQSSSLPHRLKHQLCFCKKKLKSQAHPPLTSKRLQCDRSAAWLGSARDCKSRLTIRPCTSASQVLMNQNVRPVATCDPTEDQHRMLVLSHKS